MRTKSLLAIVIICFVVSSHAAAPQRGADRLRELVIFPAMNLNFDFGFATLGNAWVINGGANLPDQIYQLREELKGQPDDIKLLLHLGNLLESNDQTNESTPCYTKAEELCRKKLAANPRDDQTSLNLGEALLGLGQDQEAERAYRKATLISSNDWRCWVGLGNFLGNHCYSLLFPKPLLDQFDSSAMPSQAIWDYHPSPDALAKSETRCHEASQCFEKAVAMDPKESELFVQRAGFICQSNVLNCFFRHFHDKEPIDAVTWTSASCSKESIANLQKAADLSPKNYQYISLVAYYVWMNATLKTSSQNLAPDALPDDARQSIHNAMTRLEILSQDPHTNTAVGALENLAMLKGMFGTPAAAVVPYLRKAVSLDPSRDQSWDLLLSLLSDSASRDELTELFKTRLKYKDSARNHLLLARAFERQEKWDQAREEAKMALKREPDNPAIALVAHLELAALALEQSSDPSHLTEAAEQFSRIEDALGKVPVNAEIVTRWRELNLNLAIYNDLLNTPDAQKSAKACVDSVLKDNPNDEQAKEILEALN
jgi:tetratricopeptide (TPR) repeat protein